MRYAILFSTLCLTLIIAVNTTTQWQIGTLFGDELSITEPHTRVVNNANSDFAQASSFSLQSQVIGNGGGVASGGSFELRGTIGQAMVGSHQGGNYSLISGFWHPLDMASNIYLPFIRR